MAGRNKGRGLGKCRCQSVIIIETGKSRGFAGKMTFEQRLKKGSHTCIQQRSFPQKQEQPVQRPGGRISPGILSNSEATHVAVAEGARRKERGGEGRGGDRLCKALWSR